VRGFFFSRGRTEGIRRCAPRCARRARSRLRSLALRSRQRGDRLAPRYR